MDLRLNKKRLGDLLVERGSLAPSDLEKALAIQQQKKVRLGEVLMDTLRIPRKELGQAIEEVQGVPYAECPPSAIAADALALIPRAFAVKSCVLPLELKGNTLVVALAEPQEFRVIEELRFRTGKQISARFSFRDDIHRGIRRFYDTEGGQLELVIKDIEAPKDDLLPVDADEEAILTDLEFVVATTGENNRDAMKEFRAGVKKVNVAVRLISMILARAVSQNASEVQVEPQISGTTVRMRIDGVLRELLKVPPGNQNAIIPRIKALADIENGDQRLPQYGRFLMICKGRRLDMRVSTLPTYFGEKLSLRVLDPATTQSTFAQLGASPEQETAIKRILERPQGSLIFAGGGRKSTSLYAALGLLASAGGSIVTVEDPVEYIIEGATQVPVDARAGLTMTAALRAVLRQNPGVLMTGEIEDAQAGEVALRAAQTGHFVLTTLNANDSLSAIARLRDLGIAPSTIASISGIIGQRLVRTLCGCRRSAPPTQAYAEALGALGVKDPIVEMFQPGGCSACDHSGYKGRTSVYELLTLDGTIRDAITSGTSLDGLRALLESAGFRSMQADAAQKIFRGITTLDEVMRGVPIQWTFDQHCSRCAKTLAPGFQYCPACGTPAAKTSADSSIRDVTAAGR